MTGDSDCEFWRFASLIVDTSGSDPLICGHKFCLPQQIQEIE